MVGFRAEGERGHGGAGGAFLDAHGLFDGVFVEGVHGEDEARGLGQAGGASTGTVRVEGAFLTQTTMLSAMLTSRSESGGWGRIRTCVGRSPTVLQTVAFDRSATQPFANNLAITA